MTEARFYDSLAGGRVECRLCPHHCRIAPDQTGRCGVRRNQAGKLYSLVYGRPVAERADPIEKKPLFHFLPGSTSFSVATAGCNLTCRFCQNSDISQVNGRIIYERELAPAEIVERARAAGCRSVSYTYTEPTVFFEYVFDTARLAAGAGLRNVLVTNGYLEADPLRELAPYLDAANVDLKSFRDEYYRNFCGGRLRPVLETLELMRRLGIWVDDGAGELREAADFLSGRLGPDTPWHLSRFFPHYRFMNAPPTPPETLAAAREIGRAAGLHYVYTGNLPGDPGENTACPQCGRQVIGRTGFLVTGYALTAGRCAACGRSIAGVFD
ncbi:MAG: Cyclic pyranopterin monophosphate synthase [candidate division TA06 bacterium ADurb.Bin417]|uniref:Cyclic pyranopterin monophosphate synthase n=1 Tax=candidate division TA06 bacterium ADurb.Bin417 TaxID=1852828 RepID=A0A1V5MK57_UNCT6|nr:MAG: Cyclic pyranopterin monophosphate synthase [candidate division TA06 bacterium ADurb.Bin417]